MRLALMLYCIAHTFSCFPQSYTVSDHFRDVSGSYFIDKIKNDIWVGTNGGAVYFNQDQQEIGYYTIMNSGIGSNDVTSILVDFDDNLWVSTFGKGVARYQQGVWEVFNEITSVFTSGYVYCMALDSTGVLWVGTNNGLMSYDGSTWTNYNLVSGLVPKYDYINTITVSPDGVVWIGTVTIGVFTYSYTNGWINHYINENINLSYPISDIEIDQDLTVWLATYGKGLIRYKNDVWTNIDGLPSDDLWAVSVNPDGDVWVGSNGGGLYLYENSNWHFYNSANSGISSNQITALYCDDEGKIWSCNVFGGVDIFDGNTWEKLKVTSLYNNDVKNLWYDNQNTMYVQNQLGVILSISNGEIDSVYDAANEFYPSAFTVHPSNSTVWAVSAGLTQTKLARQVGQNWIIENNISIFGNEPATDFVIDQNEVKWIAKYGHLYKVLNNQMVDVQYTNESSPGDIKGLGVDANNVLWVASFGEGVFYYDGASWKKYNTSNSSCPSNYVLSLAIDHNNNKWIGTTAGIFLIDPTGGFTVYNSSNSPMLENLVNDIDVADDGSVWIAVWQQVLRYKDSFFISYSTADILPDYGCSSGVSDFIRALKVDNSNKVWLGTNCNGVIVIEPQVIISTKEPAGLNSKIGIYPNPNQGEFILKTDLVEGQLFVYDVTGKLIYSELNPVRVIQFNSRDSGLYYVRFVTNREIFYSSFIVTHDMDK